MAKERWVTAAEPRDADLDAVARRFGLAMVDLAQEFLDRATLEPADYAAEFVAWLEESGDVSEAGGSLGDGDVWMPDEDDAVWIMNQLGIYREDQRGDYHWDSVD